MEPSKFWVRSDYLQFLTQHPMTRSLDWDAILLHRDLNPDVATQKHGTVPAAKFYSILELISAELDSEAVLFDVFHNVEVGPFSTWDYVFLYAPTVRAAIKSLVEHGPTRTNTIDFHYEETADSGAFYWRFLEGIGPWRLTMFVCAAIFVRKLEWLLQMEKPPFVCEVATAPPDKSCGFLDRYSDQISFNTIENRIILPKQLLTLENGQHEENLYSIIERAANKENEHLREPGTQLVRVASQIKQSLRVGNCTLNTVANDMDMQPRTLQRVLEQEGTSFRSMVESVRRSMAEHYIIDSRLPLKEIAYLLGFSELSTFSRAVKGWFGVSPRLLRDSAGSGVRDAKTLTSNET